MKSLWPLFGISNQMLAAVALVLSTVVLIKMQRTKYIWVTVIPAVWLLICTTWALGLKLFSANPRWKVSSTWQTCIKRRLPTAPT